MSRDYWSLACHAGLPAVQEILSEFFAEHGDLQRVDDLPPDYGRCFQIAERAGWTILNASAAGSLPRLASALSSTLDTVVLVNDEHEPSAYEHFAHLQAGRPRTLFTRFDEKLTDAEGVPSYAEMLTVAAASGRIHLTPKQIEIEAHSPYQGLMFLLLAMQSPLGPLAERWSKTAANESAVIENYTFAIHGSERLGRSTEATSWERVMLREPINLAVAELLAKRIELDRAIAALEQVQLEPARKALAVVRKQRAEVEETLLAYDPDRS